MSHGLLLVLALAVCALLPAPTAVAAPPAPAPSPQPTAEEPEKARLEGDTTRLTTTLTVTAQPGPSKLDIGPDVRTLPANSAVIDPAAFERSSPREPAEVLRGLSGVEFSYYGQGGIPSGPSVRGYTDRNFGQDLAGFIDGIPLNIFGFVASHGAMDLTPVFTGAVERVELVRGPLDARYGDFHRGGSINFVTRDSVPRPSVTLSGGSFGTGKGALTYGNKRTGRTGPTVYLNLEGYRTDGYAQNQDNQYAKTFNKVSFPVGAGTLALALQGYWAEWHAPSYLDRDLVRAGTLDEKAVVNPSDGGHQSNVLGYVRYGRGTTDPFTATVFAIRRDWTRWRSDFLISPTQTQTEQIDGRWTTGFRVEKSIGRSLFGRPSSFVAGATLQRDDAETRQNMTVRRTLLRPTDDVDELMTNIGLYVQEQWQPRDWLKVMGGLRYSRVDYDLSDRLRAAGTYVPTYEADIVSPKAGAAVSIARRFGLYANVATGMRSPTPRTEVRNSLGSVDRVGIAKTRSLEGGATARFARVEALAVVWRADNSNEIRGIPPGGTQFESLGRSRRQGLEAEVSVFPRAWTRVYGGLSFLSSRLTTPTTPGADHLPDVADYVHKVGLEVHRVRRGRWPGTLSASADLTISGPKDLNTTGTIRSSRYERIVASVAFTTRDRYRLWIGGFGYPGSRIEEAAFLFNTKVGVRANPRVSVEGGFTYRF